MARKSKLLAALDAHRGRDIPGEKQKKLQKEAGKKKRKRVAEQTSLEDSDGQDNRASVAVETPADVSAESDGWVSDESEAALGPETTATFDDESDSDSSLADDSPQVALEEDDEDDEDEDEDDGGIPLSDLESLGSEDKADLLPHQKLTVNNLAALKQAYKSIALPYSTLSFSAHQTITTPVPVTIPDVNDDLNRELAFYKQCLSAAESGRRLLKKEGVPFTRPSDYFAEMVKDEEQMGKVKQKMVDEAARKKASSEARRQRDLKKFGKAVQVAKLQERAKEKRDALGKIDLLKKKRKNVEQHSTRENDEDLFDVAVEKETDGPSRAQGRRGGNGLSESNTAANKRRRKDEKFGFGGKKRFAKSNDAMSTGDIRGFSTRKMKDGGGGGSRGGAGGKGKSTRLGKSRRAKARA